VTAPPAVGVAGKAEETAVTKGGLGQFPGILIVGNFLSAAGIPGPCEALSAKLGVAGWRVVQTSAQRRPVLKLLDMLSTAWVRRRTYQVAAVEVYSGRAFLWAEAVCMLLRLLGKPVVLSLHGGQLPAFARRAPGRIRRLLNAAAWVTTPSHYVREQLTAYRADIEYLPNAIELHRYPYTHRARPASRLVWLRAFHEIYNPTMAVDVVALLRGAFPDIHLTMVGPDKGDGSYEKVRAHVHRQGLAEHVTFAGTVPKERVPEYLEKGDIFISTTRSESFGISTMEAAAQGLCIVTTSVGELPYLWVQDENALLVPPDDAPAMASAVRRLLTEPALGARLSKNARENAEQFGWNVILPHWQRILQMVRG